MHLRIFNTFEPPAPIYRELLPRLTAAGHEVEVLLSATNYRAGQERGRDASVAWRPISSLFAPRLPGRARKLGIHATFAAGASLRSLVARRPDLNLFLTQPPLYQYWGRILGALRGQPYAVLIMDLYPWLAIEAGAMSRTSAASRLAQRTMAATLRGAETVITIGTCMRRRVIDLGVDPARVKIARNWANTEDIHPVAPADNALRRELGVADKTVVMYSGNLALSHDFDDLIDVMGRLQGREDIVFLFVGGGSRLPALQRAVEAARLTNVRFEGYQPYERLAESLSVGDMHFVTLREGFEGLVVPSKAYGVLAAGRPMIYQGSAATEVAEMITEHTAGAIVPNGDADALEAAIVRFADDPALREAAGQRARSAATGPYHAETALAAFTEHIVGQAPRAGGGAADAARAEAR